MKLDDIIARIRTLAATILGRGPLVAGGPPAPAAETPPLAAESRSTEPEPHSGWCERG